MGVTVPRPRSPSNCLPAGMLVVKNVSCSYSVLSTGMLPSPSSLLPIATFPLIYLIFTNSICIFSFVSYSALTRKKETRKRNLKFHIPAAICCGPSLRLLENDSSSINLIDIYEQHCKSNGLTTEDAIFVIGEKVKVAMKEFKQHHNRNVSFFVLRSVFLPFEHQTKLCLSPTRVNTSP